VRLGYPSDVLLFGAQPAVGEHRQKVMPKGFLVELWTPYKESDGRPGRRGPIWDKVPEPPGFPQPDLEWVFPTPGKLRFYAGQVDPADNSRFVIDYEFDGKPGQLEGRLAPDGRSVSLEDLRPR
jgi:hypothetical protein